MCLSNVICRVKKKKRKQLFSKKTESQKILLSPTATKNNEEGKQVRRNHFAKINESRKRCERTG